MSYILREKINEMPNKIVIIKAIPKYHPRFPFVTLKYPGLQIKKEQKLPPSQQLPKEPQQKGTLWFRLKFAALASFAG